MVSEHVLWKTNPGLLKVSLLVAKNIVISIVGLFFFFLIGISINMNHLLNSLGPESVETDAPGFTYGRCL